jgi:hypothetical protein
MRHLGWLFLLSLVVSIGCSPFEGETGQGGSGGGSTSTSTATTSTSSTTAATSTATTTTSNTGGEGGVGGAGGDNTGGAGGDGGSGGTSSSDGGGSSTSGTGGSSDFACADITAGHLAVKVRADLVPDGRAIRMVGNVDYPNGSGLSDIGWGVRGTAADSAQNATFDLGEALSGTRTEFTLGSTFAGADPNGDGIVDGDYYCPDSVPFACAIDILGCFGATELGRYVDGTASGNFAFAANDPNPVFLVP